MAIDLSKIPERLIEAARSRNLVPFIGAGISRQAVSKDPKAFPNWTELLRDIEDTAERERATSPLKRKARWTTLSGGASS